MKIELLENPIQPYAWGSRFFIAELQGRATPTEIPEAELWMGAHPSAPSRLGGPFDRVSLTELIRSNPTAALGVNTSTRFNGELPFLMKVLAAGEPLSLQAHPSRARAEAGFRSEVARGIAFDAAERNYKDPCHKPELIVALTPFFALSGFRRVEATRSLFQELAVTELESYLSPLQTDDPARGLRQSFELLLGASESERARLASCVQQSVQKKAASGGKFDAEFAWAARLGALHPKDVGVVCALFLNLIELAPGQALFLPAGNLHAYLGGAGIEIMASSDNVLRGGLTSKRVDVPELLSVLEFSELELRAIEPSSLSKFESVYRTPAEEFALSRIDIADTTERITIGDREGPEIVLSVRGRFHLDSAGHRVTLDPGSASFVPASAPDYRIQGSGSLFRARVPSPA